MGARLSRLFSGAHGRLVAVVLVLVLGGVGVGGLVAYGSLADPDPAKVQIGDRDMVLLEFAGSQASARQLVCRGVDAATPETKALGPSLRPRGAAGCGNQVAWYQSALMADLLLIGSYFVSLAGLCLLGVVLFVSDRAKRVAWAGIVAVAAAALLDLAENLLLWRGLDGLLAGGSAWVWRWAAAASVTKFSLLLPALLVAVTALLVVLERALTRSPDFDWVKTPARVEPESDGGVGRATVVPPAPVLDHRGGLWPSSGGAMPTPQMLGRPPAAKGICVSGGGIRSGTVALAALHELRRAGILGGAGYIVSVSGGGYASGAWRLALQRLARPADPNAPQPDTGETVDDPARVFAPDSPELDHVRRHGRYIADTAGQWAVALGVLLRGLVASLGLLAGAVTVVGILLGRFYFEVPLFYRVSLPMPSAGGQAPAFPQLSTGVTTATLTLAVVGLVVWLVSVFVLSTSPRASDRLARLARRTFMVTAVVVVIGVAVPALTWAYVRLAWWVFGEQHVQAASVVVGTTGGTVGLAYVGALVSILWRRREQIGKVGKLFSKDGGVQQHVPRGLVQLFIVWAVLAVLAVVYGALLVAVTWVSMRASTFDLLTRPSGATLSFWPQGYVVVVPVVFALVAILVDQTWMSLHPFYRRRIATAFSVRRQRRASTAWSMPGPTTSTTSRPRSPPTTHRSRDTRR